MVDGSIWDVKRVSSSIHSERNKHPNFLKLDHCSVISPHQITIKGGYRRAEKSRKVLMMMKAAKLGWAGPGAGQEQTMSRPGVGWEQARGRS